MLPGSLKEKNMETNRCRVIGTLTADKWMKMIEQHRRVYDSNALSPTLHTCPGGNTEPKVQVMENGITRIRKLTPLECWRLMGFDDDDFHKAQAVNSNTQLYKQAGNSIVVQVLEGILSTLIPVNPISPKEQAQDILDWLDTI